MSYKVKGDRKARGTGNNPIRLRNATRSALTVFTVDTEAQAVEAIVRFCLLRYDGSCAWTDWPQDLDARDGDKAMAEIDKVTDELHAWWEDRHGPE